MRKLVFSIAALLAATAMVHLGGSLMGTLVAMRMALAEIPVLSTGAVMSAYSVGFVSGVFFARHLITGIGHIRAFAVFASVLSAASLIFPFAVAPLPWGTLRGLQGFCAAGLCVCTESWLNERSTNEVRGQVFSFYMITIYLAQSAGQFFLILPDETGFALFIVGSILLSLALVPVAVTRVEAPPLPKPSRIGLRSLISVSPLGALGSFTSGLVTGAFAAMLPYAARSMEMTVVDTAHLMSAAIFGGLIFQWPIGWLSDRVDRRVVIVVVCLGIAVTGGGSAALVEWDRETLIFLVPLLGGMVFTLYPLSVAHTSDVTAPTDMAATTGQLIVANGIGSITGPLAAAATMQPMGPSGLFVFLAGCAITTALFGASRLHRQAPVPVAEKESFQIVSGTTSTISAKLDPRSEIAEPEFVFDTVPSEENSSETIE